jgi:hypothetical protein
MKVIKLLSILHFENFHWLNFTNIVLIPKKEGTKSIFDFRPISLIYVVAKIIAKMMATRLAPFMTTIISMSSPSNYLYVHNYPSNYLYVHNYAR